MEESAAQETREVLRAVGDSVGTLVDVGVWVGVLESRFSMGTVEVG